MIHNIFLPVSIELFTQSTIAITSKINIINPLSPLYAVEAAQKGFKEPQAFYWETTGEVYVTPSFCNNSDVVMMASILEEVFHSFGYPEGTNLQQDISKLMGDPAWPLSK